MGIQLTKEAVKAVENDIDLFAEVCKLMKVLPSSLPVLLRRNARTLTSHNVVEAISIKTGIEANQLTEETAR